MDVLVGMAKTVYGLLVDDGWLAGGTLAAFAATGLWTALARSNETLRDLGGPLLAVTLLVLLFVNLHVAGRNAARRRLR
jgi:hypothetical protein